jgi:hypothetical protein
MDKIDTIEGNSVEIGDIRYIIGRTFIKDVKEKLSNWSI